MALPNTYPKVIDKTIAAGVVVAIVPGDPNFDLILARAPQSGGLPGTPVDIGRVPASPVTGVYVLDPLPVDGTIYYYRARHVRDGWTDGIASAWSRPSKAAALVALPTSLVPLQPVLGFGGVSDETIDADGIVALGPDGRDQLSFNGDAEQGLSYWQSFDYNAAPGGSGAHVDPLPTLPDMGFVLDTGAGKYAGSGSFKASLSTNQGGGNVGFRILQTTRATNGDYDSVKTLKFRIMEGQDTKFHAAFAVKKSAAGTGTISFNIALGLYGDTLNYVGSRLIASVIPTTSWAVYDVLFEDLWTPAAPPNKYAAIEVVATSSNIANAGISISWDQLRVERLMGSSRISSASITDAKIAVPLTLTVP